jgi:hypothetical protein
MALVQNIAKQTSNTGREILTNNKDTFRLAQKLLYQISWLLEKPENRVLTTHEQMIKLRDAQYNIHLTISKLYSSPETSFYAIAKDILESQTIIEDIKSQIMIKMINEQTPKRSEFFKYKKN